MHNLISLNLIDLQNPVHKVEVALGMETDTSEIINELIYSVRKGGRIGIVGDYIGYSKYV